MNINPEIFSQIGYLSVILWAAALLLCLVYWKKPSLIICVAVLGMTIGGYTCARINSKNHVNLIQLDRSEEIAKMAALKKAKQQALLDSRGGEVAQIRFAEDGAGDFIDHAGMDDTDLKFFEKQGIEIPEWKKEKKKRSAAGADDDSIEAAIGGEKVISGVESASTFEEKAGREPILMSEVDMVMANRLDFMNLRIAFYMIFVALLLLLVDYLRRANIYGKSSFVLPLPSSWLNALTPMPAMLSTKKRDQESVRKELNRLAKRGDSFLYLTDDPARANSLPESLTRFPLIGGQEDLIPVTEEVENEFVFESLWYGRSSFVVSSDDRSQQLLNYVVEQLATRKNVRAKVAQTSHVVWDLKNPMSDELKRVIEELAQATGFSILLIGDRSSNKPVTKTKHQPTPQGEPLTS